MHDGTKLYASTLLTLRAVFPSVHLYPSGQGEVTTVVTAEPAPDDADAREPREGACRRNSASASRCPRCSPAAPRSPARRRRGELLTDDFAPVNLYDTMGEKRKKK